MPPPLAFLVIRVGFVVAVSAVSVGLALLRNADTDKEKDKHKK